MDAHPNAPSVLPVSTVPAEVLAAEDRLAGDVVTGHASTVLEHCRPEWLYGLRHRRILERAAAVMGEGREVDLITICDGQERDFMLFASTIIDAGSGGGTTQAMARIVERDWRRRETVKIGRELSNGASRDPEQVRLLTERLVEVAAPPEHDGLVDVAIGAATLMHSKITRPASLFGNGLMSPGELGILFAKPRLGKTWLALMLGRSIARGEPWLGLPTTRGRVGMIGMETPDYVIQERYRAIASDSGTDERDEGFLIIPRNVVKSRLDLLNDEHWSRMLTLCVKRRLDLLILDALSRFHTADEVAANEMGKVLGRVDDLRARSGTAVLLLHHEPKGVQGQEFSDDLDALRGSTRLQSDPTFAARLVRFKNTTMSQLRFAKVSYGVEPAPIFLTHRFDGVPVVRDSPETVGDENREKVKHQLELVGESGATSKVLMERTNLRKSTVLHHLGGLGALQFRVGHEVRWVLPSASEQESLSPEISSAATNYDWGSENG